MASQITNQLVLGDVPQNLWVVIKPNSVWNPTITAQTNGVNTNWPAGTTAYLLITDQAPDPTFTLTLNATVSGANLTWNVAAATMDTIPDGCLAQLYLDQSGNGTGNGLWLSGTLNRRS